VREEVRHAGGGRRRALSPCHYGPSRRVPEAREGGAPGPRLVPVLPLLLLHPRWPPSSYRPPFRLTVMMSRLISRGFLAKNGLPTTSETLASGKGPTLGSPQLHRSSLVQRKSRRMLHRYPSVQTLPYLEVVRGTRTNTVGQ
jgi:hypothetical protein